MAFHSFPSLVGKNLGCDVAIDSSIRTAWIRQRVIDVISYDFGDAAVYACDILISEVKGWGEPTEST